MGGGDRLDNRQSKSRTFDIARMHFISAIESLENMRQRSRRNSRTGVLYFDESSPVRRPDCQLDLAAIGRVFDCVIEEIYDHLLQARWVSFHLHGFIR